MMTLFFTSLVFAPASDKLFATLKNPNVLRPIGFVLLLLVMGLIARLAFKKIGDGLLRKSRTSNTEFPETAASFRAAFEESAFGVVLLDKEGRVLHANAALQGLLGHDLAALMHQPFSNYAHPEDAHAAKQQLTELIEGRRERYRVERRFYNNASELLWLREEVFALRGESDGFSSDARAAALIEDVTRRAEAESELEIMRASVHSLYQVIVERELDLLEKMRALLTMGCQRFKVETGVLGEVVPGGFELLQVVSPDERIRRGKTFERSTDLGDWPEPVFARHQRLPDDESAHRARDWHRFPFYSVADVEAYLSAPVFVNGELFGVLAFSSVTAPAAAFNEADKRFLQLMAQWLGAELERMQALADLEAKQQELVAANTQLEALATVDGLTGAKNRRAFDERLEMELRRAARYKTPLSLLLLDVDEFKLYNDSFGHLAGDEVLKAIAGVLSENVRVIDFVARYGGEEFAVILPQTDAAGAMIVAERLREKVANAPMRERSVTASLGIATMSEAMSVRDELIAAADRALYASKAAGRNRSTHAGQA
jgi:diguanylate cyclase (GGDEF)-like protein/PAS domain S-box-containing protein